MSDFTKAFPNADTSTKFFVSKGEYLTHQIVTLIGDDGTDCPLFETAKGSQAYIRLSHIDELSETTTPRVGDTVIISMALPERQSVFGYQGALPRNAIADVLAVSGNDVKCEEGRCRWIYQGQYYILPSRGNSATSVLSAMTEFQNLSYKEKNEVLMGIFVLDLDMEWRTHDSEWLPVEDSHLLVETNMYRVKPLPSYKEREKTRLAAEIAKLTKQMDEL